MPESKVTLNLKPLRRFDRTIRGGYASPGGRGPVRKVMKQWAQIYRGAMQERYSDLSRGGSDRGVKWKKLKKSTLARRRNKDKSSVAILIDLRIMWHGLDFKFAPSKGAFEKGIPFGITVGFGGPAKHPKAKATIADIAHAHHAGLGNLPERPLVVIPTRSVMAKLGQVAEASLGREWRRATA